MSIEAPKTVLKRWCARCSPRSRKLRENPDRRLVFLIGIVAAGGAGMARLGVLMSAVGRAVPPEKRGMASGIVNAGGSFGQFAVVPVAQLLTSLIGWIGALTALGVMMLAVAPLAWVLRSRPEATAPRARHTGRDLDAGSGAQCRGRSELRLSHLRVLRLRFSSRVHRDAPAGRGGALRAGAGSRCGWSLSLIGLFNIAGSFAAGSAIGRWRMKSVLSLLYASRAVAASPTSPPCRRRSASWASCTACASWHAFWHRDALAPGGRLPRRVAGGMLFERTGSYDAMWIIDIILAAGAALIHLPIKEAPKLRPALAA